MSRRRRHLSANRKKSALLRLDDISAALRSLAMETLNRHAKIADTDHALRLAASVERLRDRIWRYQVTRDLASAEPATKRARRR